MRAQKYDLVHAIGQVRDVVRKKAIIPALECILVKDGYIIGSNGELTVQVWMEEAVGESFLMPVSMMDMIKTLPDGIVEIKCDENNTLSLKAGKVKQRCQSLSVEEYSYYRGTADYDNEFRIPGEAVMTAISRVAMAAADKTSSPVLTGVYLEAGDGELNVVAADGLMVAWDRVTFDGESDMKVLIPKNTAVKLASLGIIDELAVSYDSKSITFRSGNFTVSSRLITGDYIKYRNFFEHFDRTMTVNRKELSDCMNRAKICMGGDLAAKRPVVFSIEDCELKLTLISTHSDYQESLEVFRNDKEDMMIGFDPVLIQKALSVFDDTDVVMKFISKKAPMLIEEDSTALRILVFTVAI